MQLEKVERGEPSRQGDVERIRKELLLGMIALAIVFCFTQSPTVFWIMTALALLFGLLLILPIGGADMPVVISMLNSYSGWAAAGIGFTLENPVLIIVGALLLAWRLEGR